MKKPIAFIDFEMNTNGDMSPEDLELIEYGLVIFEDEKVKKYQGFIKPTITNHVCEYATFITGIKNEDVLNKGMSLKKAIQRIFALTKNCQVIYTWGNIDKRIIQENLDIKGAYQIAAKIQEFQKVFISGKDKGENIANYARKYAIVEKDYIQKHRALPDAELLFKIWQEIDR